MKKQNKCIYLIFSTIKFLILLLFYLFRFVLFFCLYIFINKFTNQSLLLIFIQFFLLKCFLIQNKKEFS